jgi:hypothetical protein
MASIKEIQMNALMAWCEAKKRERGRVPIIERNEFQDYEWMRSRTLVQIDMPLELADEHAIIYDSVMKCLWEYRNGEWARVTKG